MSQHVETEIVGGGQAGLEGSEPGLYFAGLVFTYALASSLVGGVGRDAEHIAARIASTRRNGRPTRATRSQ